jgi:HAD superfamily hydrolase (TIGR01662 family)
MLVGLPASGKSSVAKEYIEKGYVHLNRDSAGGKVINLLPKMQQAISEGKNVILDNTFLTKESRAPFIQACTELKVAVDCIHIGSSFDDCQYNACQRMYDKFGKVLSNEEIKQQKKDPNTFPLAVLFSARKRFEPPAGEGLASVAYCKFVRKYNESFTNRALILDFDDTIRQTKNDEFYPIDTDNIEILPNRKEKLQEYIDKGYILLGVSNQSGVHKGVLTKEKATECFEFTNKLLGHKIDYRFDIGPARPPFEYTRKPYVGFGVEFVNKYKLKNSECIMVGDLHTDVGFAKSCGFQYYDQKDFFK